VLYICEVQRQEITHARGALQKKIVFLYMFSRLIWALIDCVERFPGKLVIENIVAVSNKYGSEF